MINRIAYVVYDDFNEEIYVTIDKSQAEQSTTQVGHFKEIELRGECNCCGRIDCECD